MTPFYPIEEAAVLRLESGVPRASVSGPRCVVTDEQELVCSYMTSNGSGINDFVPMLIRSGDLGKTWMLQGAVWPGLADVESIFCSISKAPDGSLFLYGTRTPIDVPGEKFWKAENQGIKQNELFWSRSFDCGRSWSGPAPIPLPVPASAEAPGPMCVTRHGEWLAVFAPYHSFDASLTVERNQIVLMKSADEGATWSHTAMLRFEDGDGGAEAWVVELGDGTLLGTAWHFDYRTGEDCPNAFAVSADAGATWSATASTGIHGQSTALLPYGRDSALFLYNDRKGSTPGIGLALVRPANGAFGIIGNQLVWKSASAAKDGVSSLSHDAWEQFAFGEPAAVLLPGGEVLVVYWYASSEHSGIGSVRLATVGQAPVGGAHVEQKGAQE